jgi:predicted ABC-type ATPase
VIAGPNGAGKSSLQSLLRQAHLFDCSVVNIDALEIDIDTLPADPLRYAGEIAKRTDKKFRELCEEAISKKNDFAFECNLRAEQVKYLGLFEEAGYNINLVFIWLDSLELSIDRVKRESSKEGIM